MAPHSPPKVTSFTREQVTLDSGSIFAKFPVIGAILAVIGLGVTFAVGMGNHVNMYAAYTTAFMFWLSIALGAYFFVTIFFLSRSAWNVTVRRTAENAMSTLPVFLLLFVPLVIGMGTIFHWTDVTQMTHDSILKWKQPWLNDVGFFLRAAFYFAVWIVFATIFYRRSTKQDETGDHEHTRKLQMLAAPAIMLCAIAITFAGVDWMMTTDAHWFSTIFGVYYFAGAMVGVMAFMVLMGLSLRASNATSGAITEEHIHGMGQLMYGFNLFWAYIAFSQFFLIWYGSIPEETNWYAYRYIGGWKTISIALIVLHFAVPLFFLMPRYMKRTPWAVGSGAVLLFVMHYVDMMFVIKPSILHAHDIAGLNFGIVDIAAFVGVGGAFIAVLGMRMRKNALVAYRDPRLPESMGYENM